MSDYAVFFDYNNKTYRLPINPEEIEETISQAIEKYDILKLGQIAVPGNLELREWSFETEFPKYHSNSKKDINNKRIVIPHYTETPDESHGPAYYLNRFEKWRSARNPIRFIAGAFTDKNNNGNYDSDEIDLSRSINSLVLIEELTITEKSGEEGDKYVKFKLLEYREYAAQTELKETTSANGTTSYTKKSTNSSSVNPKSTGYHVVKSGDSLWSIAMTYYGSGTKANIIFNANTDKIKNPALLTVGWKLKIPSEDEFSKYSAALPTTKASSDTSSATSYSEGAGRIKEYTGSGGAGRSTGYSGSGGAGRSTSYAGSGGAGRS